MGRALSVLFVDDDELILRALSRALKKTDSLAAHFAASPDGAVRILESHDVDVVVTDYRMPERTGVSLLIEVRARWPAILRVLMSGEMVLPLGADASLVHFFVPKPFVLADLERLLEGFARGGAT